jgi:hypothetical protein
MTNLVAVLQRVLSEYVDLLNALPVNDDTLLKIAEACACREQLAALQDEPPARPVEPFVVKHYASDERPSIKGNGFDGLEVGEDRQDAEDFVKWLNERLGVNRSGDSNA